MNRLRRALGIARRGAALILAMLVAALAATVAVALAAEQQRWFADVGNRRDQVQAQSLALAGVQWARQIINEDARGGPLDHLGETWAYPLPATPIENGSIEGRIEDAQGRLNLNNLALAGRAGHDRAYARGAAPVRQGRRCAVARRDRRLGRRRRRCARERRRGRVLRAAVADGARRERCRSCAPPRSRRCAARRRRRWAALADDVIALPAGAALNVNTASARRARRGDSRASRATSSRRSSPTARASRSRRWPSCARACRATSRCRRARRSRSGAATSS